jgi:adenosylcobyric acid synthase
MVQGTSSAAGKSLFATALCRLFARAGYRVAPFKAQNMALNAAVVARGEIGRAQAAQAEACGIEATVHMNPILLKPETDDRSQLIVHGRRVESLSFADYMQRTENLLTVVRYSLSKLRETYDVVVIEGAGSPAEVNLRASDIVNMRVARLADAPVLLVGDIDRGGVFAAFVGTLALLEPDDRARVAGFVVNRFRGARALLAPALDDLVARTGVPVVGVVPAIDELLVPAEDSQCLDGLERDDGEPDPITIVIPRLPHIANFDDFEPLAREPGVRVRLARNAAAIESADLVIVPGSKSTANDLDWLRRVGLADAIVRFARAGRPVLGICGGYQMLGSVVRDPDHVESSRDETPGLALLPVTTTLALDKTTRRVHARVATSRGIFGSVAGLTLDAYEIHAGWSWVRGATSAFRVVGRPRTPSDDHDGAINEDANVVGTYLHDIFANDALRRAVLVALAERHSRPVDSRWGTSSPAGARYDRLADIVAESCDVAAIGKLIGCELARR